MAYEKVKQTLQPSTSTEQTPAAVHAQPTPTHAPSHPPSSPQPWTQQLLPSPSSPTDPPASSPLPILPPLPQHLSVPPLPDHLSVTSSQLGEAAASLISQQSTAISVALPATSAHALPDASSSTRKGSHAARTVLSQTPPKAAHALPTAMSMAELEQARGWTPAVQRAFFKCLSVTRKHSQTPAAALHFLCQWQV